MHVLRPYHVSNQASEGRGIQTKVRLGTYIAEGVSVKHSLLRKFEGGVGGAGNRTPVPVRLVVPEHSGFLYATVMPFGSRLKQNDVRMGSGIHKRRRTRPGRVGGFVRDGGLEVRRTQQWVTRAKR